MALTPEQRQAQRVVGGIIRSGARLSRERLSIFREKGCEAWQAGAEEVTAHLAVLDVPYTVAITRGPTKRTARTVGFRIDIAWADLPALERWVPSLRRLIDAVEAATGDVDVTRLSPLGHPMINLQGPLPNDE